MRKPMVTRTIKSTEAKVLCLNVITGESFEEVITVAGTFKDEKKLMDAVTAIVNNDEVKAVHIYSTEVKETLYGMSEQKFVETAEIMPERK